MSFSGFGSMKKKSADHRSWRADPFSHPVPHNCRFSELPVLEQPPRGRFTSPLSPPGCRLGECISVGRTTFSRLALWRSHHHHWTLTRSSLNRPLSFFLHPKLLFWDLTIDFEVILGSNSRNKRIRKTGFLNISKSINKSCVFPSAKPRLALYSQHIYTFRNFREILKTLPKITQKTFQNSTCFNKKLHMFFHPFENPFFALL